MTFSWGQGAACSPLDAESETLVVFGRWQQFWLFSCESIDRI